MQVGGIQMKEGDYIFGFPDEWAKFQERFPAFLGAFDALGETINRIQVRTFTPKKHPADETVFFLGSLAKKDFTEVWLMAGNGLGTGALKVLRGMYECAVTAAYISKFPREAKQFWKFGVIAHRRLLDHAKNLYGMEYLQSVLGAKHFEQVEQEYQNVGGDFHKGKSGRMMASWSKYDLLTIAKKAGYGLEHCYYNGYAIPTQQTHSTVLAVTSRLKQQPDGIFSDDSVQKFYAGLAIMTAHVVMLKMLRVENSYFALALDSEISQREAECKAAWPGIEKECGKGL